MILKYRSSNGTDFDLKVGNIRTRTATYHDYEWLPLEHTQKLGSRVYDFRKEPAVYTTTMSIFGSMDKRREVLNVLHKAFDSDIYNKTPGRIYHGEYYVDCYITVSSTYYEAPWTQNTINIYVPYPFWIRDNVFKPQVSTLPDTGYLDYPFDYEYDFTPNRVTYLRADNPGAGDADFTLTIEGAVSNPYILMDGVRIGAYSTLGDGETLVINSKNKTVIKYTANGEINQFDQRFKSSSIFGKISPGSHQITWSGNFSFSLTIHEERSEPLWI